MQLQPLTQTAPPDYPTREEFLTRQNTLLEHVPARWKKSKGFLSAVALFVAANFCAGCGPAADSPRSDEFLLARQNSLVGDAAVWTRMIFAQRHFVTGCIAMMPPKVVPEDAAKNL
jgi:hypothetical protein